jgi:quinol-cytochrome oxidoreductase complex cytochrome b subunit
MSKQNSMIEWIDKRFPLTSNWKAHLSEYYAPKNLISGITLVLWHY